MISVILSGGSGTRLWPLSRKKLPKQFCPLFPETLFTMAVRRLQNFGEVIVCTGEDLRVDTEKAIRQEQLTVSHTLYEPLARNTAPAVALVCRFLQLQKQTEQIVGVFPADHMIADNGEFNRVVRAAQECAREGQIVTLGITPSYAATGFGYIHCLPETFKASGGLVAKKVKEFVEKPELQKAQEYLQTGNYSWNSGMFIFKVQTMIEAFAQYMPEMWRTMLALDHELGNLAEIYRQLPSQSIDFGIMEKAINQVCIPCEIGWSDLGSWDDIQNFSEHLSEKTNKAAVVAMDSRASFAYSFDAKTVCLLGTENIQVINTPDVLYIGQRGRSQEIKQLLEVVKKNTPKLADEHVFESRPWGNYRSLYEEKDFKLKVITVDVGQQLSYQSHHQRSEIWIVVRGQGEVVLNDETILVQKGSVIEIPHNAKHRMRNTGARPLSFVEVQQGEYFGEDDIIRYQDDYNRV